MGLFSRKKLDYEVEVNVNGERQFYKHFKNKDKMLAEVSKWVEYAERFTGEKCKVKGTEPGYLFYYFSSKENQVYKTVKIKHTEL